jgi:hypothetical protein
VSVNGPQRPERIVQSVDFKDGQKFQRRVIGFGFSKSGEERLPTRLAWIVRFYFV